MLWLLPLFRPARRELALVEALLLLGSGASVVASLGMGWAIDAASGGGGIGWILGGALAYAGLVVVSAGLTWVARTRIERVSQTAMLALKERLFSHLLRHDIALHDRIGAGALLARVSGDIEAMRLLFSEVILQLPGDIALVAGMFVVLGVTAPHLALIVASTVPLWVGLVAWYRWVSPAAFAEVRSQSATLSGWMAESVAAIPLLRTMDRLDFAREHTAALGRARFGADLRYGLQSVWFFNGLFGVRAAVLGAVVWVGAEEVAEKTLTAGVLLVAVDYVRKMVEPFLRLQFHITTLERARVGAARVKDLLDTAREVVDPTDPLHWDGIIGPFTLADVSFAYDSGPPVFEHVSLTIAAGKRTAFVGPTGGGKSTLVQLLARFRDPSAGVVAMDGRDLRRFALADLRTDIGLVTQSVQLLPGTVAENLGIDPQHTGTLLREVGLDRRLSAATRVGAGGETLSRGEAQLLCVARALAHEPDVLLLDEATSAMDPDTEARVMALLAARPGRTVVAVAHRLKTVAAFDHIIVIDHGVVEQGTHAELLAAKGVYAGLWAAQAAREGLPARVGAGREAR